MPLVLIKDGVIEAVQAQLAATHGGLSGLREKTMLRLLYARAEMLSKSASTDVAALAACYGYGLAHDRLFYSHNLGAALAIIELLLDLNGYALIADDTACFLGVSVAGQGELGAEAFAGWIRSHIEVIGRDAA
ncbi:MAG: death-on-curing protein [Asticcacaulis sp.]|uniref:death-on-curing protein n=1 Tax=Asticcacaulis sp. TaxID=1872648 RepID=UPI003F7C0104